MKLLRNLEKAAGKYQYLMETNQEDLKTYKNEYGADIYALLEVVNVYIESAAEEFKMWSNVSVEVFSEEPKNVFRRLKQKIDMAIVNHFLSSLSYKLAKAGKAKDVFESVEVRINQFKYWA